ncbi:MAG: hypothetical protein ACI4KR_00410 [Ruminiclostridium sp.]
MLYKAGDKVLVKPDLNLEDEYYMSDKSEYDYVSEEMLEYAGKVVTISEAYDFGYHIEELADDDDDEWIWTDEMFAGLAEDPAVSLMSFYDFAGGDNRG